MMNVQEMNGKPLHLDLIRAVFNRGHRFYSAGESMQYNSSLLLLAISSR